MRVVLTLVSSYALVFGLTLSESIDLALKNSPKISISKSTVKYHEYIKDAAIGAYHPTLEVGFNWKKLENPTTFAFSTSYNYNINLQYNLFNGLSDYYTVDSKEFELESSKLQEVAVVEDLKLSVIVAYTNYLKAKKLIKTQEKQFVSLEKQYDDTKVRYEQGVVAKNDLLLIDVEKLKAEQALIQGKSNLVKVKSNLANTIALNIDTNELIDDFDASVSDVEDITSLELKMMQNRSEMKAMKLMSKSFNAQKNAINGNYLPKVNLEARHQINGQERVSGESVFQAKDQTSYGVNVTWSLYAGMRNSAMKKALLEQQNQYNFSLHQLKLDLKNQLVQAYENYKVAKSAKHVAARAKSSAEENYRITADRYSYGDVQTLTLLVSQSNLTQAENEYNNVYYDLYIAYKTLRRIVSN
ncbi:TolC family protein [Sulfurimonas sp.]|uniref:TolC family protein n=1 Tax=Sulfurimonas sp. TaxID=2022749 RepID=UPI0025F7F40B|nr:TolC family protein [Sulfurimonas sp.]MBT5935102.1 TolC family protein [Sulfurimonas sp.]